MNSSVFTTMSSSMWTFILWISAAVYQAEGKAEILLQSSTGPGTLLGWHSTRLFHVGGAGWNLSPIRKAYSVCDITIANQPSNWLRTNFIDVKDAKMLNVKMRYNLLGCPTTSNSFCKHEIGIYVLHADKELIGTDLNPLTNTVTYHKVDTIAPRPTDLPAPIQRRTYNYGGKIIPKARGVYLAFLDQGSCVSIANVVVSYKYCPEISSVLVRFSRTVSPVNDSNQVEQTGRCADVNSINKVKLSAVCLSSGEWNFIDGINCVCKPGYELVNGSDGNALRCSETLLNQPRDGERWAWHPTKTSHSGAGWNLAASQKAYSVCDITIASKPTNWLRSDYIAVGDAKMLNIKLKYRLLGCPPSTIPFCKHKLSVYVLHVEKKLVGVDLNPLTVTYQKVDTIVPTVLPAPEKSKAYDYDGKIMTKKGGVYLAFLDEGACVSLSSVIVSYNYCSEIGSVLVRFSRTSAPVNDSYLVEQTGRCIDVNSINKVKLPNPKMEVASISSVKEKDKMAD